MAVTIVKKPIAPNPAKLFAPRPLVNCHLAAEWRPGLVNRPMVALPKYNGVRGFNQNGFLYARSNKPIQNNYTRNLFSQRKWADLEGELIVGAADHHDVFTNTTSGVMTEDGAPDIHWYIFDHYHPTTPYIERLALRDAALKDNPHPRIHRIPYRIVTNDEQIEAFLAEVITDKLEGLVLRHPDGIYKEGRSTESEMGFMRVVPWLTGEARILTINEGEKNLNESVRNEKGYLKKSSHKENKVGTGRAGSWTVEDLVTGLTFNIPVPGEALQAEVWSHPEKYIHKIMRYKFKPPAKKGGKPRYSQYEGLRHPDDMSN